MRKTRLLYIEDDLVDRMAFQRFAEGDHFPYEYAMAKSIAEAKALLNSEVFECVIADYQLGDGTVFDILGFNLEIPVIITTGAGSEQIAVQAMKAGAYDYLIKDHEQNYLKVLQVTVEGALKLKRTEDRVKIQSDRESGKAVIIGADDGMAAVVRLIDLSAASDSPVLITGETGTGKNLAAKAIHCRSSARGEPFISVNCLSLPENLIEAELFGYEKGAFTGAITGRKGVFEMADRGTIFLDEIGEMPLHLQGKLLSVIEDRKFRRLGGEIERSVNVRITASTNVDIEKALGSTFRKDLYYRLSIIRIHIPPLRDRPQDIPVLCHGLLKGIAGKRDVKIPDSELKKLMEYDWPGNVRELKNILERAMILQKGSELRPSELLKGTDHCPTISQTAAPGAPPADADIVSLEELEKRHVRLALQQFAGNRIKAAEALGISLTTLKRRLKELGSN
jgi:two-component system NtrC family response regulator